MRDFKPECRKLLVRYVVSRIDEAKRTFQIIENVDVLKVNAWLQNALKSVSTHTIKQCFKKCGFDVGDISIRNKEKRLEFQELFVQISSEITLDKHINFDCETITSEPSVDPTDVDWQQEC